MTDIKYTAAEQRAIRAAIGHIESLVEMNYCDEQRFRACRKAERKERSSQMVADANCVGWFFEGANSPGLPISALASAHNECVMMTLLGAKYNHKADSVILLNAIEADMVAKGRWLDAMETT